MKKVRLVTVTKKNKEAFWESSLLAKSLKHFRNKPDQLELTVLEGNEGPNIQGLGTLYNLFLIPQYQDEIIVFVHDDVYIHDWFITQRLNEAIKHYDVVGIAGSPNHDYSQTTWFMRRDTQSPEKLVFQDVLSGKFGTLVKGETKISNCGETPMDCKVLDGFFIALNMEKVLPQNLKFDEQFQFHLYDIDFCRQCTQKNLKLGTWPIAITHGQLGKFSSQAYKDASLLYLKKWAPKSTK